MQIQPDSIQPVSGLEIVTATGEIVSLKRGDPDFDGAVVGLGARPARRARRGGRDRHRGRSRGEHSRRHVDPRGREHGLGLGEHAPHELAHVLGEVAGRHVPQLRALRRGVDVAVACPGRLADLVGLSGPFASPQVRIDPVGSAKAIASIGAAR